MTKIYDGMTFDMSTGEVLSHGDISYVDDVDQLGKGGGTTVTKTAFDSPEVKQLIASGQKLFDEGKFGQVADFSADQLKAQRMGRDAVGIQTGIEGQLLADANRDYKDTAGFHNTQAMLNKANTGASNRLGGSSNLFNANQIQTAGRSQYDEGRANRLSNALQAQGTGARNLAGIGSGIQQHNQQKLDSAATGWQQFAGPLTGLSGKTTTSTQSGGK